MTKQQIAQARYQLTNAFPRWKQPLRDEQIRRGIARAKKPGAWAAYKEATRKS